MKNFSASSAATFCEGWRTSRHSDGSKKKPNSLLEEAAGEIISEGCGAHSSAICLLLLCFPTCHVILSSCYLPVLLHPECGSTPPRFTGRIDLPFYSATTWAYLGTIPPKILYRITLVFVLFNFGTIPPKILYRITLVFVLFNFGTIPNHACSPCSI